MLQQQIQQQQLAMLFQGQHGAMGGLQQQLAGLQGMQMNGMAGLQGMQQQPQENSLAAMLGLQQQPQQQMQMQQFGGLAGLQGLSGLQGAQGAGNANLVGANGMVQGTSCARIPHILLHSTLVIFYIAPDTSINRTIFHFASIPTTQALMPPIPMRGARARRAKRRRWALILPL